MDTTGNRGSRNPLGELYLAPADAFTIALTALGGFTKLAGVNEGSVQGMTLDGVNGTITITRAGLYSVSGSLTVGDLSGSGTKVFSGALYLNDVAQDNIRFDRGVPSGSEPQGSASMEGLLQVATGDLPAVVDFRAATNQDQTYSIPSFNLNIHEAGR